MVTLTLPCPLWEGAFGAAQGALCGAPAAKACPEAQMKQAEAPWHPQRKRIAARASVHHPDSEFAVTDVFSSRQSAHSTPSFAVGWLCSEDSRDLRRAGAEPDWSRAALPPLDDYSDSYRREYCDDTSTILTTSRSEYGPSVSASSWSSGSYASSAGCSPRESREASSSAGPGRAWIGSTRTPSPDMRRGLGLVAHETPSRRLRKAANQLSPGDEAPGRQHLGLRHHATGLQVHGSEGQGMSSTSQRAGVAVWAETSHASPLVDEPVRIPASRGRSLPSFKGRLPPPRPVSCDTLSEQEPANLQPMTLDPALTAAADRSTPAALSSSASWDPHRHDIASIFYDSREESYVGPASSIHRLLDHCRRLRESETRSDRSPSCSSDVSSMFARSLGQVAEDGASCEMLSSLAPENVHSSHTYILGPTDACSSDGPLSTVRSCADNAPCAPSSARSRGSRCSGRDVAGLQSRMQEAPSSARTRSSHCSAEQATGDQALAEEEQPPAATAVPLPLNVARTAPLLAVEHLDIKPRADTAVASGERDTRKKTDSVPLISSSSDAVATLQPQSREPSPTFLWTEGSRSDSTLSSRYPLKDVAQEHVALHADRPRSRTKLSKEISPSGEKAYRCKQPASAAEVHGELPARSAARLPSPPRQDQFAESGKCDKPRRLEGSMRGQIQPSQGEQRQQGMRGTAHAKAVARTEAALANPWCTLAEDAVQALQLPAKGCRRASSWAPEQKSRCRIGRRRCRLSSGEEGLTTEAVSSDVVDISGTSSAAGRRARSHLHRTGTSEVTEAEGTSLSESVQHSRSHLHRTKSQISRLKQSQEALHAGQLKSLQQTRSQLKEEQRLAAAKVAELQQGFCRVTAVPDSDALFVEVAQMLRTQGMPNVAIKSISRTVMNERYAQAYRHNCGSKAERVLWLASPAVDTRQILESENCLDYRHAPYGQLGRGLYGADLAVYADMFAACENEHGTKQLLLFKGIVGKPLNCVVGNMAGSLMCAVAPPGHDSVCAPEAALCRACSGTQPGCALEQRCTCPFMPVGYQSEYAKSINHRVSSPLYCLMPPSGHIQDQLLMEPSQLEPYVLALPLALVEYINPDSKACIQGEPKWWHPDVAHVLHRYRKALADEAIKRSEKVEDALAYQHSLEARTEEAELVLAVERDDKKQLEKTIKALQAERDQLRVALSSTRGAPEWKLPDALPRTSWTPNRTPERSSENAEMLGFGLQSPTSASVASRSFRGDTPSATHGYATFDGSEDSDHPEYWKDEFLEATADLPPDVEHSATASNHKHDGDDHESHWAKMRKGVPKMGQLRALRRQRIGLDFRSVKNACDFIKSMKDSASPTASKDSTPQHRQSVAHHASSSPFAAASHGHCVVLGDPVDSDLMDVPELVEIHLHRASTANSSETSIIHHKADHAVSPTSGRRETVTQRPRDDHGYRHHGSRDNLISESAFTKKKTSRAAVDIRSSGRTRGHAADIRRRRVKFSDEMEASEPGPAGRKTIHAQAVPQMEDVKKSILKLSHSASM